LFWKALRARTESGTATKGRKIFSDKSCTVFLGIEKKRVIPLIGRGGTHVKAAKEEMDEEVREQEKEAREKSKEELKEEVLKTFLAILLWGLGEG
jgi:hypothetical protein